MISGSNLSKYIDSHQKVNNFTSCLTPENLRARSKVVHTLNDIKL